LSVYYVAHPLGWVTLSVADFVGLWICGSVGHISKTKQDRPMVTMGSYIEVGVAKPIFAFRPNPRRSLGTERSLKVKFRA